MVFYSRYSTFTASQKESPKFLFFMYFHRLAFSSKLLFFHGSFMLQYMRPKAWPDSPFSCQASANGQMVFSFSSLEKVYAGKSFTSLRFVIVGFKPSANAFLFMLCPLSMAKAFIAFRMRSSPLFSPSSFTKVLA